MTHITRAPGRWGLIALLLLTTFGQIATVNAATASAVAPDLPDPYPTLAEVPSIEKTRCPFAKGDLPSDLSGPSDLVCGTITVPEDHAKPDGPTITLFLVKIPGSSKDAKTSPLFVLAGGPGQGASDAVGQFSTEVQDPIASWQPLAQGRDVILVDQRGTGHSEPSLLCPADRATPGAENPGAESTPIPSGNESDNQSAVDVYGDCAQALTDEGIDLETYTTRQSAADLDLVRQALGARQIDLLGTSYGTWLALEMMRYYPDTVRSAILNSPVPPQSDLLAGQLIAFQDSLDAVYAGCKADTRCNAAFPNLERTLTRTVKELNRNPREVTYKDPTTNKKETAPIDGQTFMSLVYQLVFIGPFIPFVPPLVSTVSQGNDELLSQLLPILAASGEGISTGLYYAVMCQDEIPFSSMNEIERQAEDAGVTQDVIDEGVASSQGTFNVCKAWDLPASPAIENTPVTSDIPALIVTGRFDPITPTSYGKELLKTLPNGVMIESPIAGHDPASTSGACGVDIMEQFLRHPRVELDTSCLDDLSIDFSLSQSGG